jgi:arylsulfatase A-like enzyme
MYSNDMWKNHPGNPGYWGQWTLKYWENGEVKIEAMTADDQPMLTTWYTEHAVDFINRNRAKPFFLYVPHSMPHVPIFCSDKFKGKSGLGLYADVMMEIDWSVGRIMQALIANGLEKNTVVIFSSDNGPWITYGNHAGRTPYRESKGTTFDGGVRSACIFKYPGEIPAGGLSDRAFCSIDILPTLCFLTGARLPDNEIDGKNVWGLVSGQKDARNPHEYYAFSCRDQLQGIISSDGRWKLHLPHAYSTLEVAGKDGFPGKSSRQSIGLALFDMRNDPYEKVNVIEIYPEIAARLRGFADSHKEKFYGET